MPTILSSRPRTTSSASTAPRGSSVGKWSASTPVTSNKYMLCERGLYELKYFFGSGVASAEGDGAAAEAVKAGIRQLIEAEDEILSDDAIAGLLKQRGFDVARRTVVKYREAMGIGSSIQRRRQRKIAG